MFIKVDNSFASAMSLCNFLVRGWQFVEAICLINYGLHLKLIERLRRLAKLMFIDSWQYIHLFTVFPRPNCGIKDFSTVTFSLGSLAATSKDPSKTIERSRTLKT